MTTLKIILASTRPGSPAPAIGSWIAAHAQSASFGRVEILDLAEINLPFLDEPEHPRLGRYTHPHTFAWSRAIDDADALIIVSPEYNGGFPAPLKNALDFLHAEWRNKALGMVTYSGGPSGGAGAAAMVAPGDGRLGPGHDGPIGRHLEGRQQGAGRRVRSHGCGGSPSGDDARRNHCCRPRLGCAALTTGVGRLTVHRRRWHCGPGEHRSGRPDRGGTGVSHPATSRDADHLAGGRFAARRRGRIYLSVIDPHRPGHHR